MTPTPPFTERFLALINGLHHDVAARLRTRFLPTGLDGALIVLICASLRRLRNRFLALAMAIQAGTLGPEPKPRPPRARATRERGPRLPNRVGWLIALAPQTVGAYVTRILVMLDDPEMRPLIAASPRVARELRKLCRMVGIETDFSAVWGTAIPVDITPPRRPWAPGRIPRVARTIWPSFVAIPAPVPDPPNHLATNLATA